MFRRLATLALLPIAALPAVAATIITQTATTNLVEYAAPVYAGWTQPSTYTGVTITANLASFGGGSGATGSAYLMNAQPSTTITSASQVGTSVPFAVSSSTPAPITLFTGLTLGPGTYYLVVSNSTGETVAQAAPAGATTVSLGSGVTQGAQAVENGTEAVYPPDTPFYNLITGKNQNLLFSVTGNLSTPTVPTLSYWAMLATAILLAVSGLLFVRRFKTAA
jgi:hypothetical protein